jgi:hypothetical protein
MSLLGLPNTWRFACFDATGIAISAGFPTVVGVRMRFDGAGSALFDASTSFFGAAGAASIANNSYVTGSTWSNTSGWLGGEFLLSVFASGGASGTVGLYLEMSPDGGVTWPTPVSANGPGGALLIAQATFASTTTASTASTTQRIAFEL